MLWFVCLWSILPCEGRPETRRRAKDTSSSSPWNLDVSGSYKSIGEIEWLNQTNIYQSNTEPLTEQRLRLQATLSKDWFLAEFADQTSLFYQKANASSLTVPSYNPVPAWNASWNLVNNNQTLINTRIDRAYVQFNWAPVEVRLGKQVIATGVGHIFNAVSQVPRYPFVIVDPEYPVTEDAATVIWDGPLVLEGRFLPRVPGEQNSDFHLRAKGTKNGFDVALTTGRSDDKMYIGLETAGNIGESLIRAELVGYDDNGAQYAQGLVGFDTVFSATWSAQFEVFYNGFGGIKPYLLQAPVHLPAPYQGKYYAGATVTWDTTARLKTNLLLIANVADPSFLIHFYLNFSLWQNVDLMAGQFLNIGGETAEFGGRYLLPVAPQIQMGLPDLTYVAVKYYF